MPPKLRKDKNTQGSKKTPANTNMFDALSEDHQNNTPTKTTSNVATMSTSSQMTSDTQLATMQHDNASMAQIIKTLSTSIYKMNKLDKIDVIKARQKSSETMMKNIVSDLCSEFENIETTTTDTTLVHTPSYADSLKTTQKTHKNTTAHTGMIPTLEVLKPTHIKNDQDKTAIFPEAPSMEDTQQTQGVAGNSRKFPSL